MSHELFSRISIHHLRRTVVLVAASIVLFVSLAAPAQSADAISIEQLMADKRQGRWTEYAKQRQSMTIEGRYSALSPKLLRFLRCEDLDFVWFDEDQQFPIDAASLRGHPIEVTGHFTTVSDKPVFVVSHIRELPTDFERLESRKLALADQPAEKLYRLADWAMRRGLFYKDDSLQSAAEKVYAEAVHRERSGLPDDAVDARLALAKKYTKYGLPEDERADFLHETFCRRWLSLKSKNPGAKELEGLSDLLDANLPGCRRPLAAADGAISQQYWQNPLAFYQSAAANTRLVLNRMLYIQIRLAAIQAWAKEQGRDSMQLADRIDREVSEFHPQADELRERALDAKLADVTSLSRQECVELAEQFSQRHEEAKALRAKRTWMQAQEARFRKEGRPDDLLQAAREYRSLLDDNDAALKLLLEAYQKAPQMKSVADELQSMGRTLVNGKWLTPAEMAALPPDPTRQAAEKGRFTGMSREQVRQALGNPDSMTRVISGNKLNEVWIYNDSGKLRVAIHFLGPVDGSDVKVVRLLP